MSYLKYVLVSLFCALFIKMGITGGALPDVAALLIMAVLIVCGDIQARSKIIIELQDNNKQILKDVADMREEVSAIRTYVSSQKMGQLRSNTGR